MIDIIGQTLGQYRIETVLGSGGMGQVYKGTHLYLDRPAAIKIMQASMAINSTFRSRFLQEAKTAAALRHPNVVEIYDYGDQDGQLYLVMELMTDGSLRTLLKQNAGQPLPLALALDLVRQAALGLAAANAMNMVHRDIKPDNLLLNKTNGTQPGSYVLKISDFGLARLVEDEGLTAATAAPMGTLAYMSPEQCQGKKVDGRSDLYSLGIVLYEVTTGLRPFKIESFIDALNKHSNAAPPLPRQLRPDLPHDLEEIILRCLAKRPEERYATANDLAMALQRMLGQVGGQTTAPSPRFSLETVTPSIVLTPTSGTYVQSSGTYIQPPETGGVLPPQVSTLPGIGNAPRVRVLDRSGATVQVVEVRMQGLTLGRQVGNDIVLNENGVSRHHLRILWDGQQVLLKDLGSSNGTYLEETRLMPQVSQVWKNRQMVRVGLYWLRLEGMEQVGTMTARDALPTALYVDRTNMQTMSAPTLVNSTRIGLSINPKALAITPGQPAGVRVTLTNLGTTVDWFTTTVEGVPPEWIQGNGQEVQLNPGMQETVDLGVNVARTPLSRAQDYAVIIRARSRERRNETNTAQMQWTVQPYHEGTMRIEPRRVTGRGSAAFNITMQNTGNVIERYEMSGEDDEQKLSYGFGLNPVDLEAGREARIGMRVSTRRRWIGREQRYPFQVHARIPSASTPAIAPGEFVNKPLVPAWLLPVVGVVLATSLVLAALFHAPPFQAAGSTSQHQSTTNPPIVSSPTLAPSPQVSPTHMPSPQVSPTAPTAPTTPTAQVSPTISPTPTTPVPPGSTWTAQSSGTTNTLNGVTWGHAKYVAVGVGGTILTSPDGKAWTLQNSGTTKTLQSVTWTGSQFIAVGDAGTILTSSDGVSWTIQAPGASQDYFVGVASSQTLIVVVGSGGSILTSPDGINWTPQNSPGTTLTGIIWTGSWFLVIGDGFYTSTDGHTWNTSPATGATSIFSGIAWSGSRYIGVGSTVFSSPDSYTWTALHVGTSSELVSVAWVGTRFIVVGAGGTILTSPDGATWSIQQSGTSYPLEGVVSSGNQYVVVGQHGTIITSP